MKTTMVGHHSAHLYGALKTNKEAWDRLNAEIEELKAKTRDESNICALRDKGNQQGQTYVVIVLLTNSLIEALANTYLAVKCSEEQFEALERMSTLEKWVVIPGLFVKEYEFPTGEMLYCELRHLLGLRTSFVHAKPRVVVNGQTLHPGNLAKGVSISVLTPDKCVSLPVRLVEHLCLYDHDGVFHLCGYSGFEQEYMTQIIAKAQAKALEPKRT
jgi:hypothetical protein